MPFRPANVAEGAGVALVAVAFGWVMHPAIGVAIVGLFLVAAANSTWSEPAVHQNQVLPECLICASQSCYRGSVL